MGVGTRLREERLRIGLSQPALAAVAGVTKGAVVKWEKDAASPNAAALIAFAQEGLDSIYILTGKREQERPTPHAEQVIEGLDAIKRDLLMPRRLNFRESEDQAEQRALTRAAKDLNIMLKYGMPSAHPDLEERAKALLEIVEDPSKLPLFRAVDFAQKRQEREETEDILSVYFQNNPYQPDHSVMRQLVMIAMDYRVPLDVLVELASEIYIDIEEQRSADSTIADFKAAERDNSEDIAPNDDQE